MTPLHTVFGYALAAGVLGSAAVAQHQMASPNYRVFPSAISQTEPVIAVHPTNPMTMFAASRTINTNGGFQSEGVYVTTNGGVTWFGSDTCRGANIQNHGGDPGIAILPDGGLVLTHIGSLFLGIYSHYSNDLGASWSNAYTIFSQSSQPPDDKGQATVIDNTPTSLYYGRVYSSWAIVGSPFTVLTSYTTNGGLSWSIPATINPTPPARCSGAFTTVGLNGNVYTCWAGLAIASPFAEDFVGFAASADGGVSWRVTQNAFDMNGIKGLLAAKNNILVNGLPQVGIDGTSGPRSGWIYVATTEKTLPPAGSDPDIIFHRSTNDGVTWSSAIRVNQDPLNNGKIQYFPAIDVDSQGGINIIYYDDRNTSADSSEIVLARSVDGGNTWTERVVSDHRFKPKPIAGFPSGYQGDHIALTSVASILHAFWMDDFSGIYQVWSTAIDITTLGTTPGEGSLPNAIELKQNYPNPFNPSTTIEYHLAESGFAVLLVLDMNGKAITRLVAERQVAGNHSVVFNTEKLHLASGIYFYRLSVNGFSSAKQMVLLR